MLSISWRRIGQRPFVLVFLLAFVAVEMSGRTARSSDRPNVIVVMTDDQGYGDLGATGNPLIRTPSIDALSRESGSMSDFYVCPVCSPTRASLMTGRYHYRTRVVDTFKGRSMMEPEEVTIAEILKAAGYATGVFGKWHLGDNYPLRPQDQGFDEVYIHKGGGLAQPSEPIENQQRYTDPILFHNGKKIQTKGYCTDLYFDAAIKFIGECSEQKRPFFVYLPTNAPHGPYHDVPGALYDYYKSLDLAPVLNGRKGDADRVARVYAMIENVDQNVGRLRERLENLGLSNNTILMFLVDNGPNTRRYVGPFRGMKTEVHEGGIRSPLFVHWPGRIRAGVVSDRISAHIDLAPTILDAAGIAAPAKVKFDGRSLLPLLRGENPNWSDRSIVIQAHRGDSPVSKHHFAIRSQHWKLLHPTGFGREGMPKDVPFELYDMRVDQAETNNLYKQRPDVAKRMLAEYQTWFEDVSTTRPDNYAPPRIIVGSDSEPESILTLQDWRVREPQGWGRNGRWLIHVARSGNYEAELIMSSETEPSEIVVHVNDQILSTQAERFQRVAIQGLSLAKGDASIGVSVKTQKGKSVTPYQLILRVAK